MDRSLEAVWLMGAGAVTDLNRSYAVTTNELERMAARILASPLQERGVLGPLNELRGALLKRHATAEFLRRPVLAQLGQTIGGLTAEPIRLRTTHVRAGTYRYPPPADMDRLLRLARADLAQRHEIEAVGLCGLFALMVHPYSDGNGRLCRTLWLHGLLARGFRPAQAVAVIDDFYWVGADAVLALIDSAQCGDPQPVLQHWLAACDGAGRTAGAASDSVRGESASFAPPYPPACDHPQP